jgi:phosphate transport system protein
MSPRKAYQEQLDVVSQQMTEMGVMAKEAIALAVKSFQELDPKLVDRVQQLDKAAYQLMQKAEKNLIRIIALNTPVAGDLRFIATSLKVTTDFDRIVRYAKDIADITERSIAEGMQHFKALISIPRLSEMAISMVDISVDCFINRELKRTEEVFRLEDEVDALYSEVFREVLTYMMEDSHKISMGMNYQFVARYLERIADHACNISERVVYMETGERVQK